MWSVLINKTPPCTQNYRVEHIWAPWSTRQWSRSSKIQTSKPISKTTRVATKLRKTQSIGAKGRWIQCHKVKKSWMSNFRAVMTISWKIRNRSMSQNKTKQPILEEKLKMQVIIRKDRGKRLREKPCRLFMKVRITPLSPSQIWMDHLSYPLQIFGGTNLSKIIIATKQDPIRCTSTKLLWSRPSGPSTCSHLTPLVRPWLASIRSNTPRDQTSLNVTTRWTSTLPMTRILNS